MKIRSEELKSALKIVPEQSDIEVSVDHTGNKLYLSFTDTKEREVRVILLASELGLFPMITYTERLPK